MRAMPPRRRALAHTLCAPCIAACAAPQVLRSAGSWLLSAAGLAARGAKLLLLLALELGAFPLAAGLWLDVCALPLTATSLAQRSLLLARMPLVAAFMHWLLGVGFLLGLTFLLCVVREVLRPGSLPFLKDPTNPERNPVREMLEEPLLPHLGRVALSWLVYAGGRQRGVDWVLFLTLTVSVDVVGVGAWRSAGCMCRRVRDASSCMQLPVSALTHALCAQQRECSGECSTHALTLPPRCRRCLPAPHDQACASCWCTCRRCWRRRWCRRCTRCAWPCLIRSRRYRQTCCCFTSSSHSRWSTCACAARRAASCAGGWAGPAGALVGMLLVPAAVGAVFLQGWLAWLHA